MLRIVHSSTRITTDGRRSRITEMENTGSMEHEPGPESPVAPSRGCVEAPTRGTQILNSRKNRRG